MKSQVDCEVGQVRLDPTDESSACVPDRCAGVNCKKSHAKCTVLADGLTGYGANGEADTGNGFSCVLRCHSGWLRLVSRSFRAKCSVIKEIKTMKVTCPNPFDRCTNLAEGETGMSDGGIQDSGDGYSCECEDRRIYDQSSDTCVCMGKGSS